MLNKPLSVTSSEVCSVLMMQDDNRELRINELKDTLPEVTLSFVELS